MQHFGKVIIGGGIAGVTCGNKLGDDNTLLLEAKSNLGGRMSTLKRPDGDVINLGGELINAEHTTMQRLVNKAGLELTPVYDDAPKERYVYQGLGDLRTTLAPLSRRLEIDTKLAEEDLSHREYLMKMPLKKYLDEIGISDSGKRVVLDYAELMYGVNSLTALCLIELNMDGVGLLSHGADKFMIKGGSQGLVEKLAERVNVSVSEPVTGIEKTAAGYYEITLNSGRVVACDRLVIAAPLTTVRNIDLARADLPKDYIDAINNARYGESKKVVPYFAGAHDLGSSFVFSERLKAQVWENGKGTNKNGLAVTIFLGADSKVDGWWSHSRHQFSSEFPELPYYPSNVYVKDWTEDPYALGSYHVGDQDPVNSKVEMLRDPFEGIHFAGEHVGGSGYMEYAARSGIQVADRLKKA